MAQCSRCACQTSKTCVRGRLLSSQQDCISLALRLSSQQDCISLALRAPWRDATVCERGVCERGVLSEYPAARARASYWFDKRCARPGEAFCPNIQPRAHARLTGLTRAAGNPDRTPRSHVSSGRAALAVRVKCSLAGLTTN